MRAGSSLLLKMHLEFLSLNFVMILIFYLDSKWICTTTYEFGFDHIEIESLILLITNIW